MLLGRTVGVGCTNKVYGSGRRVGEFPSSYALEPLSQFNVVRRRGMNYCYSQHETRMKIRTCKEK